MKRTSLFLVSSLALFTMAGANAASLVNGKIENRHVKQGKGLHVVFKENALAPKKELQALLKLHQLEQSENPNKGQVYAATTISNDEEGSVGVPFRLKGFDILDIKNMSREAHDYTVTTRVCFISRTEADKEFCSESEDYLSLGQNGSFSTSRQAEITKVFDEPGSYWGTIGIKIRNDQQDIVFETSRAAMIDVND